MLPKTNSYHKTNNQPVILSEEKRLRFAKSNFRGLSEANERKRETFRSMRDIAWGFGGFLLGCNIPSASHRDFKPYPFVAIAPRFCIGSSPRAAHSLNKTSTSVGGRTRQPPLRMTYRTFILLYTLDKKRGSPSTSRKRAHTANKDGRFVNRPYNQNFCRCDHWSPV